MGMFGAQGYRRRGLNGIAAMTQGLQEWQRWASQTPHGGLKDGGQCRLGFLAESHVHDIFLI